MIMIVKKILINFFLIFLTIELFFKRNYIYSRFIGFADYFNFFFYLKLKNKLNNKNILCFNNTQLKIVKFFFPKNIVKKVFFTFPERFSWNSVSLLVKISNTFFFKPYIIKEADDLFKSSGKTKKTLLSLCNNQKISKSITNFFVKKYICIYVRHYNENVNSQTPSVRQTANLDKIFKIISFLIKKKINILVLGVKSEPFQLRIKSFLRNEYNNKLFYFSDLTDSYSIEDQLQIANNSLGYIGSATGHVTLFHYLNKKVILFDYIEYTKFQRTKAFLKNKITLYKKIKLKGQLINCHVDNIKKAFDNDKILNFEEVTFNELKFNVCKLFKKNIF
jgi:hypothetical protein